MVLADTAGGVSCGAEDCLGGAAAVCAPADPPGQQAPAASARACMYSACPMASSPLSAPCTWLYQRNL